MNKLVKTVSCTGMAVILAAAGLSGCGNTLDGTKTAATVGEEKITAGTVNMMLRFTQAQMDSYYAMFGGSISGLWSQEGEDGKTYAESTKDDVKEQIHDMVLLEQHAPDYDVSVSEEEHKKITEAAKQFMEDNDPENITKLAVTQADIEKILELYTYQSKMFDPMTADVDTNVEDKEAQQSKITYCRISTAATTDEDGNSQELTEEEKAAKKEQAQKLIDQLNAQEDPAAADMDALAKEIDENLGAYTNTFGANEENEESSLDENLVAAAKELKDGQVASQVIEGEDAYFVVRMDSTFDEESTQSKKDEIVSERKQEAYNDLLEQWGEETEIKVVNSVWKKMELTDMDNYTFKQSEEQ